MLGTYSYASLPEPLYPDITFDTVRVYQTAM